LTEESRNPAPNENLVAHTVRWQSRLPPILAVIAGMSDVIGFLSFKLFTAHITGNIVVIAALLVRGGPPDIAQVLAVPVFMVAVGFVWGISKSYGRRGRDLARLLLIIQFLLFVSVLLVSVVFNPAANPNGVFAAIVPLLAVSAIASQFTLLRIAFQGAPSTAVMTGNTTNLVLSLLDSISRGEPLIRGATERLKKTLGALVGFFAGCLAGAAAVSWFGNWSWSFPVAVAAIAVILL